MNPKKWILHLLQKKKKEKKKADRVIRLDYQVVKLNLLKKVRYPDVILNEKLMWNTNAETRLKKEVLGTDIKDDTVVLQISCDSDTDICSNSIVSQNRNCFHKIPAEPSTESSQHHDYMDNENNVY